MKRYECKKCEAHLFGDAVVCSVCGAFRELFSNHLKVAALIFCLALGTAFMSLS